MDKRIPCIEVSQDFFDEDDFDGAGGDFDPRLLKQMNFADRDNNGEVLYNIVKKIFSLYLSTVSGIPMDLDWTEKARQHSAGRSAHDLSQKIATPSCGECRS